MNKAATLALLAVLCALPAAGRAQGYNSDQLFSSRPATSSAPIIVGSPEQFRRQEAETVNRTAEHRRAERASERSEVYAAQSGGAEVREVEFKTEGSYEEAKGTCYGRDGKYFGLAGARRKRGNSWTSWHFAGKGGASAQGTDNLSLIDSLKKACQGS
ncbi:MAG: hypothetical protein HY985_05600 [Magnetospirillum sp.]|nr:hypothetical protein [Magnetospirillum sp.]